MPRKRGQNEGSIYRMKDRRWRAAVSIGWKNSKRVRKTFTAQTRTEVAEKLIQALRSRQLGLPIAPEKQTVGQFLCSWLEKHAKSKVRPLTYRSYSWIIHKHLVPALGKIPLIKLTAQQVETFLSERLAAGFKPRTVQHIHATLRVALNSAVRLDMLPRNVAQLVRPPSVSHREVAPFTREEAQRFFEIIKDDRLQALWTLTVAVGLRQAEALGLLCDSIDLENGVLTVRHTLQRIDSKLSLVDTKTARSRRTLVLPPFAVAALVAHQARQQRARELAGTKWRETGFMFTTQIGTPLDGPTVSRRFRRMLQNAGFRALRYHDLRHICASVLLAQGVHPRLAMEALGHSTIAVTMNTYSAVIPALRKEVASQIEAAFGPVATCVATQDTDTAQTEMPN